MKEIAQLRKVRSQVADRITQRTAARATAERAVEAGGDPAELVALAGLIEADQRTLERMDRRIADIAQQEERATRLTRLLERGRQADEAQDLEDVTWQEVHDEIDRAFSRLYGVVQGCRAVVSDFHQDALHLAPIFASTNPGRQEADELREELLAKGATLRAVGVAHYSGQSCVFENAGGPVHAPRPERWGWLIQMAIDGLDRKQAMIAERRVRAKVGGAA